MDTIFRKVDVKERLPEKPIKPLGGHQVNDISMEWGIEKVVFFHIHDEPIIVGFHYESKRWHIGWNCRSEIVDETKYIDVTNSVAHWLEEVKLPNESEKELAVDEYLKSIGITENRMLVRQDWMTGMSWLLEWIFKK